VQPVVAQLVRRRGRELRDAVVAGVERGDEALDRAALPGGVPALEDDEERWPDRQLAVRALRPGLAAERQAQVGEPLLRGLEPGVQPV
jgi:hypothetical protein